MAWMGWNGDGGGGGFSGSGVVMGSIGGLRVPVTGRNLRHQMSPGSRRTPELGWWHIAQGRAPNATPAQAWAFSG